MIDVAGLIERCRAMGAVLTPLDNRLKVQAPKPLSDDLMANLKQAKQDILVELRRELRDKSECWLLEEWRRISIPDWRCILQKSIEESDKKREEYARWMLKEILEDSEYKENE